MKEFACVLVFAFGLVFSVHGFAAGVIETAVGQVRAGTSAAIVGQRITAGTNISTGPKSRAIVRFEDGQAIVLPENSEFRVAQYAFSREQPANDRFNFELIKGALRSVTATLTRRNSRAYSLRTPTSTMGIRGTDFMVATVNPVYLRVLNGSLEVVNSAGPVTFGAGSSGIVATETTLAITIPFSALPPAIAATFSELAGLVILVDGAVGAAAAASAAEGTLTLPVALGIAGAIAAGIAAAASGGDGARGFDTFPITNTNTSTSTR